MAPLAQVPGAVQPPQRGVLHEAPGGELGGAEVAVGHDAAEADLPRAAGLQGPRLQQIHVHMGLWPSGGHRPAFAALPLLAADLGHGEGGVLRLCGAIEVHQVDERKRAVDLLGHGPREGLAHANDVPQGGHQLVGVEHQVQHRGRGHQQRDLVLADDLPQVHRVRGPQGVWVHHNTTPTKGGVHLMPEHGPNVGRLLQNSGGQADPALLCKEVGGVGQAPVAEDHAFRSAGGARGINHLRQAVQGPLPADLSGGRLVCLVHMHHGHLQLLKGGLIVADHCLGIHLLHELPDPQRWALAVQGRPGALRQPRAQHRRHQRRPRLQVQRHQPRGERVAAAVLPGLGKKLQELGSAAPGEEQQVVVGELLPLCDQTNPVRLCSGPV
mmetsp:Transcript_59802/g.142747  ORF Transcript_59802/g.142747 Transcript_59802/m.142747 type:complete len:383 (-) Transcript_59802:317-1465(-)